MVDLDSNPTKLHRGRRDRQADADDPRRADDVLHRQRRGEVLRHHPGDLPRPPTRSSTRSTSCELRDARERDPLGGHLQRPDHHGADPARAPRRPVPAATARGPAAAQPADLRRRRRDRPVRRHQAHRSPPRPSWGTDMVRDIRRALIVSLLVLTVLVGGVFPVAVWAVAQVAFNDRANGSLIVRDGTRRRIEPARPGLHQPDVLPAAAVRRRLHSPTRAARRLEPRPELRRPGRRRQGAGRRRAAPTASPGRRPGRPGDRVGAPASTRTSRGRRAGAGRPRRECPRPRPGRRSGRWCSTSMQSPTLGLLGTTRVNVLELNLALDRITP